MARASMWRHLEKIVHDRSSKKGPRGRAPRPLVLERLEARLALTGASLLNGHFDQGVDGLEGWSVTDPTLVMVDSDHKAVLRESAIDLEVDLFQDFQIAPEAQTLSFTLSDLTFDDQHFPGDAPDAFGVSLLDPFSLSPIVSTVNN